MKAASLKTYPDAVADVLYGKGQADKAAEWVKKAMHLGHPEAKALAKKDYGVEIFWCMEAPRAREGYYRIKVLLRRDRVGGIRLSTSLDTHRVRFSCCH